MHWVRPLVLRTVLISSIALAIVAAGLLAPALRARAAGITYYVAPGGTDAGPCTQAQPCASLLRAAALARPGDTVLALPGTYGPQAITANGAPAAPIVVRAQGSVTLTRPLPLTAQSQAVALLRLVNSSYLTVEGFRVLGAKTQPGYNAAAQPYGGEVELENHGSSVGQGLVVRGLSVAHANNTCLKVQDNEPGVALLDNTLLDCGRPGDTLDHGLYDSGPDGLIAGNTIAGASGWGIHVYGGNVGGARIVGNTVSGAYAAGILDALGPGLVSGNTVYANGSGVAAAPGVTLARNVVADNNGPAVTFWQGAGGGIGGVALVNNTFYRNGASATQPTLSDIQGYDSALTRPITVEDNIIVGRGPGLADLFNAPIPATSTVDHNLYHYVTPSFGKTNYDQGHSLSGVDARFVDPSKVPLPDLHLEPNSPAIGANTGQTPGVGLQSPDLGALCYSCTHAQLASVARPFSTPAPPSTRTTSQDRSRSSPRFVFDTTSTWLAVGVGVALIVAIARRGPQRYKRDLRRRRTDSSRFN